MTHAQPGRVGLLTKGARGRGPAATRSHRVSEGANSRSAPTRIATPVPGEPVPGADDAAERSEPLPKGAGNWGSRAGRWRAPDPSRGPRAARWPSVSAAGEVPATVIADASELTPGGGAPPSPDARRMPPCRRAGRDGDLASGRSAAAPGGIEPVLPLGTTRMSAASRICVTTSSAAAATGTADAAPVGSTGDPTGGSTTSGTSTTGGTVGTSAPTVCAAAWTMDVVALATEVDVNVFDCVTGPLSPGLNTRTETEVLEPGSGAPAVSSQPHRQSQTQVVPGWLEGTTELVSTDESPQFQIQVQIQVKPESEGGSGPIEPGGLAEFVPFVAAESIPLEFGG
jgi:hypothetical protein